MSYLMADVLEERDVPFVFTTGYDSRTAISAVGSGHRPAIGSRQANVGQRSIKGDPSSQEPQSFLAAGHINDLEPGIVQPCHSHLTDK
jgi:hypothetical protein